MSGQSKHVQELNAANDLADYWEKELDIAEGRLREVEATLAETENTLAETEEAQQDTGRGFDSLERKCKRHGIELSKLKAAASIRARVAMGKTRRLLNKVKSKHEKAMADMVAEHEAAIDTLRQEMQAGEKQKGSCASLDKELRTADATIKGLQLQLDRMSKDVRQRDYAISRLTEERDAAREHSESAVATSVKLEAQIKDLSELLSARGSTTSANTTEWDLILLQLAELRGQLRVEAAAREQAQAEVNRLETQTAGIEAMIDDAIGQIGCTNDFANRSKLDYIPESARVVLMMQAEGQRLSRQLDEERTKASSLPIGASSGEQGTERGMGMEAQLRAHIQAQTVEIAGQAARIEKQKSESESRIIEAKNLNADLQRKVVSTRALEKQLAREQARATELDAFKSENAFLLSKNGELTTKIREHERLPAQRARSLTQTSRDKERAITLLAETTKKLKDAEEHSMFRRMANKLYMLRIDKDTETLASLAVAIQAKDEHIAALIEQMRETDHRLAKIHGLLLGPIKPVSDLEQRGKKLVEMQVRERVAEGTAVTTITTTTKATAATPTAARTYPIVAILLAILFSVVALIRLTGSIPAVEPLVDSPELDVEVVEVSYPPSLTIREFLPPTRVSQVPYPIPGFAR